jgi:hypothetical protein
MRATPTCLYCGVEGHNCGVRKCPKLKDLHTQLDIHSRHNIGGMNSPSLTDIYKLVGGFSDEDFLFACLYKRKSVPNLSEDAPKLGTHASILKHKVKLPVEPFKAELMQYLIESFNKNLQSKKRLLASKIKYKSTEVLQLQQELRSITGETLNKMNIRVSQPAESVCSSINCPLCYEDTPFHFVATTGCNHKYCIGCTYEQIDRSKETFPPCALCRAPIKNMYVYTNFARNSIKAATK